MPATRVAALVMLWIAFLAGPAPAQEAKPGAGASLDDQVQKAIEKGVAKIWSMQKPDGSWPAFTLQGDKHYTVGPTAMCVYPLLESGVPATDPRMAKALDWLAAHNDDLTYTLGLRCQVWLIADRQTKNKYIKQFEADVKQLLLSAPDGKHAYSAKAPDKAELKERESGTTDWAWDNSNGQIGVLGVWAGARANMEFIPEGYWRIIMKHWIDCQNSDGGFHYARNRVDLLTTPSMTAAGVATLLVCLDNTSGETFAGCQGGQRPEMKAVNSALDWLDRNFQKNMEELNPYYLYALERVGLASGLKYFGTSDWYKQGAELLVRKQAGDGTFPGAYGPEPVGAVWGVLFLVRGRNPVMFNKLQYTGDWNNRPRALASLTEWASKNFEQTVSWQIINTKVPVSEWHDAPILFISGSKAPTFTEEELAKLRTYVQQGGTIFSVGECGGAGFNKAMRLAYAKLFPEYELKSVDKDHDLYSTAVQFPLKTKPHFFMLSNGIRPLAVHVDEDMVLPWQTKASSTEAWAYQGAANLYLYVTDKGSLKEGSLKARGVNRWPEQPNAAVARTVKVARLKYGGNWDPEPLAYERFGRMLAADANGSTALTVGRLGRTGMGGSTALTTSIGLEVVTTEMKDVAGSGAAVATLTGTGTFTLGAEEKDAMKKFVEGGGLLVIDAAGGSRTFAESAENMIQDLFGVGALKRLDAGSPLYAAREIKEYKYRRATRARLGGEKSPQLRGVMMGERLGVIYSREDLTGGLVGYSSFGCDGYAPQTAYEIMRNAILLASGQRAAPTAPPPAAGETK